MTQRATFGAGQLISQRRPRETALHDVVPLALSPSRPVVLLVVVVMLVSAPPPVLLLVLLLVLVVTLVLLLLLTLWLMLMLFEFEAAPAPFTARQSRTASVRGNLMVRLQDVR